MQYILVYLTLHKVVHHKPGNLYPLLHHVDVSPGKYNNYTVTLSIATISIAALILSLAVINDYTNINPQLIVQIFLLQLQ